MCLSLDKAIEYMGGVAGHAYGAVVCRPFDAQSSSIHDNRCLSFGFPVHDAGYRCRASARPASLRDSGSAFPDAHTYLAGCPYLREFHVCPIREKGMGL